MHVDYEGHDVLDGVDLRAVPGRMVAVTGPSGAGKTTLLWVLAGLVRPARGEVLVGGRPPRDRDHTAPPVWCSSHRTTRWPASSPRPRTSWYRCSPLASTRLRHARGPPPPWSRSDWAPRATSSIEELSGGQQQRVAVARGLAQRGTVVLADEPTSELDAANRARVVALLRAEAERGAAVVLATHDPEAAAECDAELHLDAGAALWLRPLSALDPTTAGAAP